MKITKKIHRGEKKKMLRVLAGEAVIGGALALFVAAFAFAADAVPQPGQKIFLSKCAQCHGKDAKGLPNMANVLLVKPELIDLTRDEAVKLPFKDKVQIVTNGKNKMLKFKKKLTDAQIQQVVTYLESMQKAGGEKK
jgi:cytochrome c6